MMRVARQLVTIVASLIAMAAPALAQGDETIDAEGGPSTEFFRNFKFASITLSRKAYSAPKIRQTGMYLGLDITLVQVPSSITSEAINEAVAQYLFIPMPLFSFERSTSKHQDHIRFMYATTSPLAGTGLKYTTINGGRTLYLDGRRKMALEISALYTAFAGNRSLELGGIEMAQDLGLSTVGAEMSIGYRFGNPPPRKGRGTDRLNFMAQGGLGMLSIASAFDAPDIDTYVSYQANVGYLTTGLAACAGASQSCALFQVNYDLIIGSTLTLTFVNRL